MPCCPEFRMHSTDQYSWLIIAQSEREEHAHAEKPGKSVWINKTVRTYIYEQRRLQRNKHKGVEKGKWLWLMLFLCLNVTLSQHLKSCKSLCKEHTASFMLCCLVSSAFDELLWSICLWHISVSAHRVLFKYLIQLVYTDIILMALIINQSKRFGSVQITLGNHTA